jgi:hypothetical protein
MNTAKYTPDQIRDRVWYNSGKQLNNPSIMEALEVENK